MNESEAQWMYMTPDGVEYGPYGLVEVRLYVAEGRILSEGSLRRVGGEVGWRRASEVLQAESISAPPEFPSDASEAHHAPRVPATTRPTRPMAGQYSTTQLQAYILLGILPGIAGVFGIHNLVAGYTTKGVVQLVCGIVFIWSGACLAGPLGCFPWLALMIWTIIEVCQVRVDAQGRPFLT